ncbi:hypothetical protein V502_01596 [Pseudogymnoascus sp. VKM F-4520 (FW-2644)]|nr:hypothetical protein V502_01596 [Pseudogymnoascus sp. VKM F-4520 (FW-2644)]
MPKEQLSASYYLMMPAVDHTSIFCCKVPPHCREKLASHIKDLYQWSILTARKAALFNKQLTKLRKGTADYKQATQLITTRIAFDTLEKSRDYPSSDTITFQLSAKEWRKRFNVEVARREALEIKMMGIKGENAELMTEMKALREEEATRTQELEKAREVLLITSRILEERALKASEDSQKITHAATSLMLGSNPCIL